MYGTPLIASVPIANVGTIIARDQPGRKQRPLCGREEPRRKKINFTGGIDKEKKSVIIGVAVGANLLV